MAARSFLIGYGRGVFIEITHRCRPHLKTSEKFQLSSVKCVCVCIYSPLRLFGLLAYYCLDST